MNAFGGAATTTRPPEKGAFPLDHYGECKEQIKVYLACLREKSNNHIDCKHLSQQYLQCRMDKGLMQPENLEKLGFDEKSYKTGRARSFEGKREKEGFVAGTGIKAMPTPKN
ncbi:hypothetical protein SDRG_09206 [Saprolegnia diclina VS20]|uniref:CHCH domain-containing protein n=2 Tax=Saprolegnia TaxID=4769 RepID=A0A067CIX3_SAPPC|nr:hypothetical protein SDRG_09206 [Saprolegnia diclina VS20]XP_012200294.1 hypothetical protein SPRG_06185 [Saprolegnia parasitica CBS 223.65]EQC33222.1 hypothetical protein SDRG_09206 [Saprolegnia diclina VS20]KDO29130.1 hypothetical protein SPRG_06185 [Saprolegnia parasitica CBS 223.65]|eukprot:XP_008613345.1 hypothetical protein SDRG_09206 [Saprolegnia diclina VS20]